MARTTTESKHRLGPVVIVVLALMILLLVPAMAQAATGTVTWQGRGPNPAGESVEYHFVLTPGGNTVLHSGSIDVTFTGGGSVSVSGAVKGGTRGAMHFYVTGTGPVVSASATVTYTGSLARSVLTISDATVVSTTTTVGGTTSTTGGKMTTTTVTTVGGVTSTTGHKRTTTTTGGPGTTVEGVTSTTGVAGGTEYDGPGSVDERQHHHHGADADPDRDRRRRDRWRQRPRPVRGRDHHRPGGSLLARGQDGLGQAALNRCKGPGRTHGDRITAASSVWR